MLQLAHESLYKCRNVLNALVLLVAVVIFIRGGHSMSRPTSNDKQIRDRSASMHILYICTLIISSQSVFKQHPDKTDTTAHLHLLRIQWLIWMLAFNNAISKGINQGRTRKVRYFFMDTNLTPNYPAVPLKTMSLA